MSLMYFILIGIYLFAAVWNAHMTADQIVCGQLLKVTKSALTIKTRECTYWHITDCVLHYLIFSI